MKSILCFRIFIILLLTIIDMSLEKSIEDLETKIKPAIMNGYDGNYK